MKYRKLIEFLIFAAAIGPIIGLGVFSYMDSYNTLTEVTLARRQSLAYLASAVVKERLDHILDIGASLATRVQFRNLIDQGKWEEAILILQTIPDQFPFIERIFVSDPSGTLMADIPEIPEVHGQNFSFRDWYQGVSKGWKPYISEVYKRTAQPRYNVVTAAIPIKKDSGDILGVLVMQIKLDDFVKWSKEIDVGPGGVVYFVDRNGHVIVHPQMDPQGEIVDFSSIPVVQKLLKGEKGVEISYNPVEKEERLTGFEPILEYGWGAVVTQPTKEAFAQRNETARKILIRYSILFSINFLFAFLVIRIMRKQWSTEELAALSKGEDRFKKILEHSLDIVHIMDQQGYIKYVTPSIKTVLGYEPSEFITTKASAFVYPDDIQIAQEALKRLLSKAGSTFGPIEERIKHKNGEWRWMEVFGTNLLDVPGIEGIVITSRDITERKKISNIFKQHEQQLSTIYDTVGDVIFMLEIEEGGHYRFISVNNAFFSITGLRSDQVVGKLVDEVIPQPALSVVLQRYSEAIRTKKMLRWEETSDYPTGRLTGEVSVVPIFNEEGKCTHLVGSVHDITKIKARTEELERLNKVMVGRELRMVQLKKLSKNELEGTNGQK